MKEIVFVGNPNVGKSAWINALSDAQFEIGNWPGVTVEKKEAIVHWKEEYHLVDLPGLYSLYHPQNEETIAATYLKKQVPDLIVNVVDTLNLRQSLHLTLMLRELQIPMIMILNFYDQVEKFDIHIDVKRLQRRLQIPIICGSAFDEVSHQQVKQAIHTYTNQMVCYYPLLNPNEEHLFMEVLSRMKLHEPSLDMRKQFQTAIMVLEDLMTIPYDNLLRTYKEQLGEWDYHRLQAVDSLMCYVDTSMNQHLRFTKRLDEWLLHPVTGPLSFVVVSILFFLIVFRGSAPWTAFISYFIQDYIGGWFQSIFSFLPNWVQAFLLDGVLAGVGGVLSFIPLMVYLHFFLAVLEESGYMARIACMMDRVMRYFHFSGKSFIALLLGFGCNVPAIYATRTLENESMKKRTALLIPFMSCGARLPVYVLFASAFFGKQAPFFIIILYVTGIGVALFLSVLFHQFEEQSTSLFYLELPIYRIPNLSVLFQKVKKEIIAYVHKTLTLVVWVMMFLWAVSYFPNGTLENSFLATFMKPVSVLYEPLGFGTRWESVASLPAGVIAKESVIGFLGQLMHQEEVTEMDLHAETKALPKKLLDCVVESVTLSKSEVQDDSLSMYIANLWTDPLAKSRALSFMMYVLLSIPCVMTLGALKNEYGKRIMLYSILLMTIVPYVFCFGLFQLLSWLHL